jgi:hypothetical protein
MIVRLIIAFASFVGLMLIMALSGAIGAYLGYVLTGFI